jgi:hypothetical protein
MSEGGLKKLQIIAYSDGAFKKKIKGSEFETSINPEKYNLVFKPEYKGGQAPGTSDAQAKFNKIAPQELSIDVLFDSTGAIDGVSDLKKGIVEKLKLFKRVVFDYHGTNHKPNYLMVKWGDLLFKGSLVDLSIEYKLFAPDGTPIRALAKLKLIGSIDDDLRIAKEKKQSPDLTHYRLVKDGETLPLMCDNIYGDSKYYLEVAKVNNLVNFRKLKAGQELFFPPLKKTS